MAKMMWWEEQSAMAEDYKDLEWLAYNSIELVLDQCAEMWFDRVSGCISEQMWAVREGLTDDPRRKSSGRRKNKGAGR